MPNDHPTVWVSQERNRLVNGELVPLYDLSPAKEFGTVRTILNSGLRPWHTVSAVDMTVAAMEGYNPARDFLLPSGAPLFIGIMLARAIILAEDSECSHVQVLQWETKERHYVVAQVPIGKLFI